jgi:hypothetical protein
VLTARRGGAPDGIAQDFFPKAAWIVDRPWQMAAGEDFRHPETEGKKAPGTDLLTGYVAQVHRATHHGPVVLPSFCR